MALKRWAIHAATIYATIVAALPSAMSQTHTLPPACAAEAGRVIECVKPSETDPAIRRFDTTHYILFNTKTGPEANLLVFLHATDGVQPGPLPFLKAAADAGYRVISLAYNDSPAVNVYCPGNPDSACSEKFRRMRIYGDGTLNDPAIDNTGAESIVNRLVKLLQYLDRRDPKRKWGAYLENGTLSRSRIALAGWSQGAGMAALIAKEHLVARVVLFSGPVDFQRLNENARPLLAAWISAPSETPPERWFGGYHERESGPNLLARAYAELQVPPDHVRVFKLDLGAPPPRGNDPFHGEAIRNPAYAEDRAFFLGRSR
jgi:predicted esterase